MASATGLIGGETKKPTTELMAYETGLIVRDRGAE
jgi:hypothetical protein